MVSHRESCLLYTSEGLQNNYSLRIVHNEEQISKNTATLGNAGYFTTLDFYAGYTGNLDLSLIHISVADKQKIVYCC